MNPSRYHFVPGIPSNLTWYQRPLLFLHRFTTLAGGSSGCPGASSTSSLTFWLAGGWASGAWAGAGAPHCCIVRWWFRSAFIMQCCRFQPAGMDECVTNIMGHGISQAIGVIVIGLTYAEWSAPLWSEFLRQTYWDSGVMKPDEFTYLIVWVLGTLVMISLVQRLVAFIVFLGDLMGHLHIFQYGLDFSSAWEGNIFIVGQIGIVYQ